MLYIKTDYLALISLDMIRIAIKPILFILYYFLYLVPRTNKIWLFGSGSGHSFSDNAKYLFLYSSNIDDVNENGISCKLFLKPTNAAASFSIYSLLISNNAEAL